jgi:hypothetical protein
MAEQHANVAVMHAGGVDEQAPHDDVRSRTADHWLPFLRPQLRPWVSLIACGSGVGSLTRDLAARVAPGSGPRCARATPCGARGIA